MYHYVITLHGDKVRDCQDYAMARQLCERIKGSKIMILAPREIPQTNCVTTNVGYTDLRYKKYQEV